MSLTAKIFEESKGRIASHTEVIFDMLSNAGQKGVTNNELAEVTPRFGSPLHNLRLTGFDIVTENLGNGLVKYTLKENLIKRPKYVKGVDAISKAINEQYNGNVTVPELLKIMDEQNMNFVRKPNTLSGVR